MTLNEILAKVAKGETLSDDEKGFCESFDLQTHIDTAASGARRKAEKERDTVKMAMAELQAKFDELSESANPEKAKAEKLTLEKRIAKLEQAKAEAEAQTARLTRDAKVRQFAKEAGIIAARGIDSKILDKVVDGIMADVDLEDADAVKTVLADFKKANAGMISAQTVGGVGVLGTPGGAKVTNNPWKKETFNLTKQIEMLATSPDEATRLKAEAGVEE